MQRQIIFDANDLLKLLTHYTHGAVPLDARLKEFVVHPHMQQLVGFWVESGQWDDLNPSNKPDQATRGVLAPMQIRYEGKKVMSWTGKGEPIWKEGGGIG